MSQDFFYALLTGWFILLIFWVTVIIFILIRKPPNSKLTSKIILRSLFIFVGMFLILIFLNFRFGF